MNTHSFPDTPLRADTYLDRGAHFVSRLGGPGLLLLCLLGLIYLLIG